MPSLLLSDSEVDALHRGTFDLSPLHVTLERQVGAEPASLSGAGAIRQAANGALVLTLLADEASIEILADPSPLGQAIPPEARLKLTAEDSSGRRWRTTLPPPGHMLTFGSRGPKLLISAGLQTLETATTLPMAHPRGALQLYLFSRLRLPTPIRSRIRVDEGTQHDERSQHNVAALPSVAGYQVEFTQWETRARIVCSTSEPSLPEDLDEYLIGALQLVAGQALREAVSIRTEGDEQRVRIASVGLGMRPESELPPILSYWADSAQLVWELFSKYFAFSVQAPKRGHAVTTLWDGVVASTGRGLDTRALVTCVAVEGILPWLELPLPPPNDAERAAIASWRRELLSFLERSACPTEIRRRFANRLGTMDYKGTAAKLRDLAAAGYIDDGLIEPWERLRNRIVHGAKVALGNWKQILHDSDAALCLLHQLTFAAIGYRGRYTYHGTNPWTIAHYPDDIGKRHTQT